MMDRERTAVMVARLKELSYATAEQRWREFSMRVPADTERDADLVLMRAAMFIEELRVVLEAMLSGDVGRQTLAKLADGQGTDTDDGRAWLRAAAIVTPNDRVQAGEASPATTGSAQKGL